MKNFAIEDEYKKVVIIKFERSSLIPSEEHSGESASHFSATSYSNQGASLL